MKDFHVSKLLTGKIGKNILGVQNNCAELAYCSLCMEAFGVLMIGLKKTVKSTEHAE